MSLSYHAVLAIAYGSALAGVLLVSRLLPSLWTAPATTPIANPWRELGWALFAAVAVLGVGQLYVHGWMLPAHGTLEPVLEPLNQLLIYSPMLVLLALRKQLLSSAWIRTDRIPLRLVVGIVLALLAVLVFTALHPDASSWLAVVPRVYAWHNLPSAVQVLMEDITIAILVVRLSAITGQRIAALVVAALFAAGHIPAMLASGATGDEIAGLIRDAALGLAIITVAQRSCDIWWLWCVHFAMDMMQVHSGAKLG